MPTFSRIVTIYNQWSFLDWLDHDELFTPDTEFIVMDDHSDEPVPAALAARLAQRSISVHRLPRNSGRCVARNTGASLARGEFLDFIDGDDRPLPIKHDAAWAAAGVIFFKMEAHSAAAPVRRWLMLNPLLADPASPDGFLDPRPVSVLWRRSLFVESGGFDARFETSEDFDLVLRTLDRPRAYSLTPKQSYFEHTHRDLAQMTSCGIRISIYRRLPDSHPLRQQLIDAEVHTLYHYSTWHLLHGGHRAHLFRSALSLLWNLLKSLLRLPT